MSLLYRVDSFPSQAKKLINSHSPERKRGGGGGGREGILAEAWYIFSLYMYRENLISLPLLLFLYSLAHICIIWPDSIVSYQLDVVTGCVDFTFPARLKVFNCAV